MIARRLLVVDDSEMSRTLIRRILEREGVEVLVAADGAEGAVVAFREHPDAVVTDLEMPVMDGYQLARLLKSDSATADIPLLILTSRQEASSRFWGLETGADAYLVKDELGSGLLPALDRLLGNAPERKAQAHDPPRNPLEVLARVSRHLDARLLETVLVNRVLERGMKAETVEEASQAVLDTVADFVDHHAIVLATAEPEGHLVVVKTAGTLGEKERDRFADEMLRRLGVPVGVARQVICFQGGAAETGPPLDPQRLIGLPIPLRGATGLLGILPRRAFDEDSRDAALLRGLAPHLSLVLDNARLAQRLRELSMIDGLTRLLNRRSIHQRLTEEIDRARRYGGDLAVVLCDLDHFKRINDTHGHLAGDTVLVAAAEVLRRHLRKPDSVGRFGGEEFLVLLPGDDLESGSRVARRLLEDLGGRTIAIPTGGPLTVTASLGVASLAELDDPSPHALVALADRRLYEGKAGGRNRVVP